MKSQTRFMVIIFLFILFICFSFSPVLFNSINKLCFRKKKEPEHLIINEINQRLEEVNNPNDEISELSNELEFNQLESDSNLTETNNIIELSSEEHYSLGQLYQYGKYGRQKNLKMAQYNFNKAINLAERNDHELIGKCHLSLAQIHENTGNISSVDNILNHYLYALKYGYEESIIHIGKLYLNGLHPFCLPDKMIAAKIFSTFLNFSDNIKPWCQLHLQDIYKVQYRDLDTLKQNDITYNSLPDDIVDRMLLSKNEIRRIYSYKSVFNKTLLIKTYDNDEEDFPKNKTLKHAKGTPKKPSILLRLPKQIVHNDSQNVHDHSLQNIGNIIIDKLGTENNNLNTFDTNKLSLFNELDERKYPNVKRVCNSLIGDTVHSRFNKTEQDVFNLIWERVKNDNDLKSMFFDNINSCIEHDYVVCSTGKIMRILSTLDIVDNNVPDLKPEWVIKQEIMQTIANTINNLSSKEKTQYESSNNNNIRNIIEKRVRTKCSKDYKDILQDNILDLYLKEYLEHI